MRQRSLARGRRAASALLGIDIWNCSHFEDLFMQKIEIECKFSVENLSDDLEKMSMFPSKMVGQALK